MNLASEYVASILEDTLAMIPNDKNPFHFWIYLNFSGKSYCKSAIKEMIELIRNTDIPPLVILESYRDTMEKFKIIDPRTSGMFVTGEVTAEYFIRLLLT